MVVIAPSKAHLLEEIDRTGSIAYCRLNRALGTVSARHGAPLLALIGTPHDD